ncbi:hypothetical protein SO802_010454 [Lithocarpus litseifolius]|uniref:Uncharacterized protein n=1 Tax=Lithocarpus litseifolius TaxID=425828 RepID=A0AAW2DES4_9ROSI
MPFQSYNVKKSSSTLLFKNIYNKSKIILPMVFGKFGGWRGTLDLKNGHQVNISELLWVSGNGDQRVVWVSSSGDRWVVWVSGGGGFVIDVGMGQLGGASDGPFLLFGSDEPAPPDAESITKS